MGTGPSLYLSMKLEHQGVSRLKRTQRVDLTQVKLLCERDHLENQLKEKGPKSKGKRSKAFKTLRQRENP